MITISVCMIVKNEEKHLARCLDSLQGLWDELIIVDTGSTDSTKEIAARYTDRIYDHPWRDDFAHARNYAFSLAGCDHIYAPDADEVLDAENRRKFARLKQALLPEVEIVQMIYVNRHAHKTTENFEKDYRPKLFKRLRTFQWIDPVHETIRLQPIIYDSDIEILHMPSESHAGRDLRIFRSVIRKGHPLSARLHNMYARELFMAGAAKIFWKPRLFSKRACGTVRAARTNIWKRSACWRGRPGSKKTMQSFSACASTGSPPALARNCAWRPGTIIGRLGTGKMHGIGMKMPAVRPQSWISAARKSFQKRGLRCVMQQMLMIDPARYTYDLLSF